MNKVLLLLQGNTSTYCTVPLTIQRNKAASAHLRERLQLKHVLILHRFEFNNSYNNSFLELFARTIVVIYFYQQFLGKCRTTVHILYIYHVVLWLFRFTLK